jgi:N-acetylneuraminic acid mutarotase
MRALAFLTAGLAVAGCVPEGTLIEPAPAPAGGWRTGSPLPRARGAAAFAVLDDRLYLAGGYAIDQVQDVDSYDPESDTWLSHAALPVPRHTSTPALVHGGRLLVVTGVIGGFCTDVVHIYDPGTNAWSVGGALPVERCWPAVTQIGDRGFVIGGTDDDGTPIFGDMNALDLASGDASVGPAMPTPRTSMGVTVLDGRIYTVGGYNGTRLATLSMYDPQANAWTELPPLPEPRLGLCAAGLDGKLYAVGGEIVGEGGPEATASVAIYDPAINDWSEAPPMHTPRVSPACAVMNGELVVVGGAIGLTNSDATEIYTP